MDSYIRKEKKKEFEESKLAISARAAKKQTISQIASIGRKYRLLKYPILFFLIAFIFIYNFTYYFCLAVRMREKMARAVALGLCVVLVITSVDLTAFAFSTDGNNENEGEKSEYTRIISDKEIISLQPLDDSVLFQTVEVKSTLDNIVLPDSLSAIVSYQVEKTTVVEKKQEEPSKEVPVPEEVPETAPEAAPETAPEAAPETAPEEAPEADPEEAPESAPEVDPEEAPESAPEADPEEAPESAPEETPETAPETTPEETPGEAPETAPEETPEVAPEVAPETAPETTPEEAPESTPESTPEAAPEEAPEAAPETAPEPPVEPAPENSEGGEPENPVSLSMVEILPIEETEVTYTEEEILEQIEEATPEIVEYVNEEPVGPEELITASGASLTEQYSADNQVLTETQTVEEEVRLSVDWIIDEENSSKAQFDEIMQGEVYVFLPVIKDTDYVLSDNVTLQKITVKVEIFPAFEASTEVEGITVSVTADEGVLPKNATVKAELINNLDELMEEYSLEESEMLEGQLLEFDITIYDEEGEEIEPDTSMGNVYVSFSNPSTDGSYETSDWSVYHVDEENKTIEALDMEYNTVHGEIVAQTDSFSVYIVSAGNPAVTKDGARQFNLANGSVNAYASAGTTLSITGEGTNTSINLINDSGKETTFYVYVTDINCEQNSKNNNDLVVTTNGNTTNVYIYVKGNNYLFSNSKNVVRKKGDGAVNIFLDSLETESSYISFQQSNLFSSTKAFASDINIHMAPNGAYVTGAYSNIFGEESSGEVALSKGKSSKWAVAIRMIGKVQLYLDTQGGDFFDEGNIDGEYVRANAQITLPTPAKRRGYVFDGYQISRPYTASIWGIKLSGGWTDYSDPTYKAGDVVCPDGDSIKVIAHYTAIPNTVNINLKRNGVNWSGQNVSLYLGAEKKYSLAEANGVYRNTSVINGNYNIYVDEENSGYMVNVDCDRESISVSKDAMFESADITVKLDDVPTSSLGDVILRKNGLEQYRIKSSNGVYSGTFSKVFLPLDIFVDTKDTGFDYNLLDTGFVQTVDYYTMEVTIADDAPWQDAYVQLKDSYGIVVAEPELTTTNGNNTVYTRIMQKDASPMGVYGVYVNDVEVGNFVSAVSAGRKTTVGYFTSKITMHTNLTEAAVSAANGIDNVFYEKSASSNSGSNLLVYEAKHVLKRMDSGSGELPYKLTIENVVDSNINLISSNEKNKDFELSEVRYHNSANTLATGDGTETDEIIKRQYVRKNGILPRFVGNVARNSYTFGHWSKTKWSPKLTVASCPEYDYTASVTGDLDLYAVYLEPDVKIGDLVYTDSTGKIGGNGQYYRMGNLAISGFEKSEDAIGFIYLTVSNASNITLLNKNSIFNNLTVTNGSTAVTLGTGTSKSFAPNTFGDKIAILFKTPVSMAKAQDFLQNCLIVNPKENVEHTLEIMVTDAGGSYVAANSVKATAAVSYTIPNKPVCIDGYSAGSTLYSGTYYITANKTFSGSSTGNGLKIASGATVYIYIPKGVTLSATGKNGSGTTPGYAAIYLPNGANLYILGEGKISATGGRAGDGGNGSPGTNAYGGDKYMTSGSGGNGGFGGGGAGAGIGTNGANGVSGGWGAGGWGAHYQSDGEPGYGGNGSSCQAPSAAGNFYYDTKITLDAHGGSYGSQNGSGAASGGYWADSGSGWKNGWCAVGAGGGGGGGGCGFAGAGIGTGGYSGGGGGGGASGGHYHTGGNPKHRYARNGGPGSGGLGGNGAWASAGSVCTWGSNDDGKTDNENFWGRGGAGGSGGKAGSEITKYNSGINVTTGTVSFDVSSSKTVTGKYNAISFTYGKAKTITLPSYTNSDPHVHFLGWEVKTPAKNNTSGAMLTQANYRISPGTSQITLAEGTYGNVTLVAVVETFGGISDKDNINALHYKYTKSAPAKTYSNYSVNLLLNGQKTTKGNILIGTTSVAPSEDGSYTLSVDSGKAAASLEVYVEGENVGSVSKNGILTVEYSSLAVTVEGIASASVILKGENAPILTEGVSTKVGGKTSTLYSYEVLKSKATNAEYEVWINGEYTETNVKYQNPVKVSYYTDTIEINTVGYDATKISSVELRDLDNNRLFAGASGAASYNRAVFSFTRFTDERPYSVYVDGVKVNSFMVNGVEKTTLDFTGDVTATLEKIAYTTTIRTMLNDELAEIGTVVLGDSEGENYQLVRSMTGVYSCIITHEIEGGTMPLYIEGRLVNEAQEIGRTDTYNYYTIEYRNDERSTGILPVDSNIYFAGDEVTLLTGSNLVCGAKTFVGWSVNEGATMSEGDKLAINTRLVAIPIWKRTDFGTASENFQLTIGASSFVYDGTVKTPSVSVYHGKAALKEDRDYTISYFNSNTSNGHDSETGESTNAINAGTVTIKVTGVNDYTGTLEATYWIAEKEISVGGLAAKNKVYDGSTTVALTVDEAYLEGVLEGDDVYLMKDNTTGEAYTKMAGDHIPVNISETKLGGAASSNYRLKTLASIYVDIYSKDLKPDMFELWEDGSKVNDTTYTYANNEKKPLVVATDMASVNGEMKNILNEAFYTVSYSENVHAGTAKVTISENAKEPLEEGERLNYKGSVVLEYKINKRPVTVRAKALSSVYREPLASLDNAYVVDASDIPEKDLNDLNFKAVTNVAEGYNAKTYKNAVSVEYDKHPDYEITVVPADYTVTKTDIPVPFSVKGYSGVYDGLLHGIDLSVASDDNTAKVYYSVGTSLDSSNYASKGTLSSDGSVPDSVKVKNAGEYTVYFYITSDNYQANSGSAIINLSKATLNVTAKDHNITYGDSVATITGKYLYDSQGIAENGYSAGKSDVTIEGFVSKEDAALADKAFITFTSISYRPGARVLASGEDYDLVPAISAASLTEKKVFDNYDILYNYGSLYVEKKAVSFSWPKKQFTYSGSLISVPVEINGILEKDEGNVEAVFDESVPYKASARDAGTYEVSVSSLSGILSDNYKVVAGEETASTSWEIVKAENAWSLTPGIQSWVLSETGESGVPYGSAKFGEVIFAYAAKPSEEKNPKELEYSTDMPDVAGEYYMKAYVEETGNYGGLESYVQFEIREKEVEKEVVYVTCENVNLTYGEGIPDSIDLIYSFADEDKRGKPDADKINSDEATYLTSYNPGTAETRAVGTYSIAVSGVTSEEYELIYKPSTLTVTQKEVSLIWPDTVEFNFDNFEHGICATVDPDSILFADDVYVGGYEDTEDYKNYGSLVGQYTAKVSSLGGNSAQNYKLPENPSKKWKINKALEIQFTVQPTISDWYYGEAAPTPFGESNIGEVTFKYQEAKEEILWNIFNWKTREIPKNPGTYRLIACVDDGTGSTVESNPCEFTIFPATAIVTPDDSGSVFGEDISELTYAVNVTKGSLTDSEINKIKNKVKVTTEASKTSDVGAYKILVSLENTDKALVLANEGQYTITPATITFEGGKHLSDVSVTYDAASHTVLASKVTGKAKDVTTVYYSTSVLNNENYASGSTKLPVLTNVGSETIYFYAVAKNFYPASGSAKITVTKKNLTVTARDDAVGYGDSAPDYSEKPNVHVTYSGFEGSDTVESLAIIPSFTFGKDNDGAWTAYTKESAAGEYLIRPSVTGLTNYNVVSVDGKLTVNKKNVEGTYSFDDLFAIKEAGVYVSDSTYTYDGTEKKPDVAVKSGLDVNINFERDFEVSYSNNVNAGEALVTVTAKDGGSFAGSLSKTFTINKRAVTLQALNAESYYNNDISEISFSEESGSIVASDVETLGIKGATTAKKNSPVGTYETTIEYKDNTNYIFTIKKGIYTVKPSTISVNAVGYEGIYDGREHGGSITAKTGKFLTSAKIYYSTAVTLSEGNYETEGTEVTLFNPLPGFKNVTSKTVFYYVTCENFEPVSGSYDVLIKPAEVSLSWTIDDESKQSVTADDKTHLIKASVSGSLADGDSLNVTEYVREGFQPVAGPDYSFIAAKMDGENPITTPAEFSISAKVEGNGGANYVVHESTFNYIVMPATSGEDPQKLENPIETLSVSDWEYGDYHAPISTTAKYGEVKYKYFIKNGGGTEETTPVNSGAQTTGGEPSFVGSYTVEAYVEETSEYQGASTSRDFEIKKAQINIIADDASGKFGEAAKNIEDKYATNKSPKEEDNVEIKAISDISSSTIIGEYPIDIEVSCEDDPFVRTGNIWENGKYIINVTKGTYFVLASENMISVSATGYTGTYDKASHGISVSVSDKAGHAVNDVTVYYSTEELSESNFGIGNKNNPLFTDAGTYTVYYYVDSDKYAPVKGEKTVEISKKNVTVTPKAMEVTYGDATIPEGSVLCDGFIGSDSLSALGITPTISVDYAQYCEAGEYDIVPHLDKDAANYSFTLTNGTLTVKPYPVTFRWSLASLPYNGNDRSVVATPYQPLNGDEVGAVLKNGTKKEVGSYKAEVIGLSGSKAGSYTYDPERESSSLDWEITKSENKFTEKLSMKGWTYGETEASPECSALFGTIEFKYYTDISCEIPTNTQTTGADACGAALEGGKPSLPGVYYVKASIEETDEYELLFSKPVRFVISKGSAMVKMDNVFAQTSDPKKPLTFSVSGKILESDNVVIEGKLPENTDISEEGVYAINALITSNDEFSYDSDRNVYSNAKYDITVIPGTYYVNSKNISISCEDINMVYDGEEHAIAVSVTTDGEEYSVYYSETPASEDEKAALLSGENITLSENPIGRIAPGEKIVYYYVVSDGIVYEGNAKITIKKALLTIYAKDKTIVVGSKPANNWVKYEGFVGTDNETKLIGLIAFDYSYSVGDPIGEYVITPKGVTSTYYDITFVDACLTVVEFMGLVSVTYSDGTPSDKYDDLQEAMDALNENGNGGTITFESSPIQIIKPFEIPENVVLNIPEGQSLIISETGSLDNKGTINNEGLIVLDEGSTLHNGEEATIHNEGTLTSNAPIDNEGSVYNDGTFESNASFTNMNEVINDENGEFISKGRFENLEDSSFENSGETVNEAEMINNGTITNSGDISNVNEGSLENNSEIDNEGGSLNDSEDAEGPITNNGIIKGGSVTGPIENNDTLEDQDILAGEIYNKGTMKLKKGNDYSDADITNTEPYKIIRAFNEADPIKVQYDDGTFESYSSLEEALEDIEKQDGKIDSPKAFEIDIINSPATVNTSVVIPEDIVLSIPNGQELIIEEGGSLENKGTVENEGSIKVEDTGELINDGSLENNGEIELLDEAVLDNKDSFENNGKVKVSEDASIDNEGTFENAENATINNKGDISNKDEGTFQNKGNIVNESYTGETGEKSGSINGDGASEDSSFVNEGTVSGGDITGPFENTSKGTLDCPEKLSGDIENAGTWKIARKTDYSEAHIDNKDGSKLIRHFDENDLIKVEFADGTVESYPSLKDALADIEKKAGDTVLGSIEAETITLINSPVTVDEPLEIPSDITLVIPNGQKLVIEDGGILDNKGTIENDGEIEMGGTSSFKNEGTLENTGNLEMSGNSVFDNEGELSNEGEIELADTSLLENEGTFENDGKVEADGYSKLENKDGGTFTNESEGLVSLGGESSMDNLGDFTNEGSMNVGEDAFVDNEGGIVNKGNIVNEGDITNHESGSFENEGEIENEKGTINGDDASEDSSFVNKGTIRGGFVSGPVENTSEGTIEKPKKLDGEILNKGILELTKDTDYDGAEISNDADSKIVRPFSEDDPICVEFEDGSKESYSSLEEALEDIVKKKTDENVGAPVAKTISVVNSPKDSLDPEDPEAPEKPETLVLKTHIVIPEGIELEIAEDQKLVIGEGGSIENEGTISINGEMELTGDTVIDNKGTFENNGDLVLGDNSSVNNEETFENNGDLSFAGTSSFDNKEEAVFNNGEEGTAHFEGNSTFENNGSFENEGEFLVKEMASLTNEDGTVLNSGKIDLSDNAQFKNQSEVENEGEINLLGNSSITNEGNLDNKGKLNVDEWSSFNNKDTLENNGEMSISANAGVKNTGEFTNKEKITNEGSILNLEDGAFENDGTVLNENGRLSGNEESLEAMVNKGTVIGGTVYGPIINKSEGTMDGQSILAGKIDNEGTLKLAKNTEQSDAEINNEDGFKLIRPFNEDDPIKVEFNDGTFESYASLKEALEDIENQSEKYLSPEAETITVINSPAVVDTALAIPKEIVLVISKGQELVIEEEGSLSNEGSIENNGTVKNSGDISNKDGGSFENKGTVDNEGGSLNGDEDSDGIIKNVGTILSGSVNGPLENEPEGTIEAPSKLSGKITNKGSLELAKETDILEAEYIVEGDGKIVRPFNEEDPVKVQFEDGSFESYTSITEALKDIARQSDKLGSPSAETIELLDSIVIDSPIVIPKGVEFVIPKDTELVVEKGGSIDNKGKITNKGTITNDGDISNKEGGSFTNEGKIDNEGGSLNGDNDSNGTITNNGKLSGGDINGMLVNGTSGSIENPASLGGDIVNNGTIEINGETDMSKAKLVNAPGSNFVTPHRSEPPKKVEPEVPEIIELPASKPASETTVEPVLPTEENFDTEVKEYEEIAQDKVTAKKTIVMYGDGEIHINLGNSDAEKMLEEIKQRLEESGEQGTTDAKAPSGQKGTKLAVPVVIEALQEVVDAILTDSEKEAVSNGEKASIGLLAYVTEFDEEVLVEKGAAVSKEKPLEKKDVKLVGFLDTTFVKQIGEDDPLVVTELNGEVRITVEIPENLRTEGRTFVVMGYSNGEYVKLEAIDNGDGTITYVMIGDMECALGYIDFGDEFEELFEEKEDEELTELVDDTNSHCGWHWATLAIALAAIFLNILLRRNDVVLEGEDSKKWSNRTKRIVADAVSAALLATVAILGDCSLEYIIGAAGVVGCALTAIISQKLSNRE